MDKEGIGIMLISGEPGSPEMNRSFLEFSFNRIAEAAETDIEVNQIAFKPVILLREEFSSKKKQVFIIIYD